MDNCFKHISTKKSQPENTDNMSTSEQQKMAELTLLVLLLLTSSLATLWGENSDNLIWQELGQASFVIIKKII